MTDILLDFGTIDSFAASSAVTYCPVTLDLGADNYLANGVNAKAVFVAEKATTGFVPMLFSGSGNAPTDVYADLRRHPWPQETRLSSRSRSSSRDISELAELPLLPTVA